jgi:hypothetical protein
MKSISIITYFFVAFLVWLFIFAPLDASDYYLNSNIPLTETPIVAQILGYGTIVLFITLLITVYSFVFPLLRLMTRRIGLYIRLHFTAARLGFKFKLKRIPLTSLFGVKNKEDISIVCGDKKYLIHFVDVVGRARVFTLIDEKTYEVSKTGPGDTSKMPFGAARLIATDRIILKGRRKKIPEFDKSVGEHIILLDPPTMEVRYIDGGVPKSLFNGYSVGNITYYEAKGFIGLLKRI